MNWFNKARNRWTIILVLFIAFTAFKWQDVALPYFWDEMAGYMSGVVYMDDHGISLLPSAVPADLSYGHPLLMHATMACVAELFGNTPTVMHCTTLLFTFLLALGVYFLALQLGLRPMAAVFAYTIFLFQPIVIAQSTQVLLEVFLALHTVYAILFYLRKQYVLSAVFTVFAVLTKETGLVLAIALMGAVIVEFIKERNFKEFTIKFLLFDMPFLVFAAFLIIQEATYGWYLNPTNVGKTNPELQSMIQKLWDYPLEFGFKDQGRIAFTLVVIVAGIVAIRKPQKSWFTLTPATIVISLFLSGFVLFSCIADAHERYMLSLFPFISILFASSILHLTHRDLKFAPLILILCLNSNLLNLDNGKRYRDSDLSYRDMVKTNVDVFNFVNSGAFKEDTISWAFPLKLAPTDKRFGYFDSLKFIADTTFKPYASYKVYCSPGNIDWNPPDTNIYELVKGFNSSYSVSGLYRKMDE